MSETTDLAVKAMGIAMETLVKDVTAFVADKFKDFYEDTVNKEDVDSGWAFEEYLQKVYKTYSMSKSIVYINTARKMSSFFIPMNLKLETSTVFEKAYTVSGKRITDVLKQNDKVIITGIGGMGKTMHMKHFCIDAIKSTYKIPVYIQLRWFNNRSIGDEPFENLIYERLKDFGFRLKEKYFLYSLESGNYVFLLDGFDEIRNDRKSEIAVRIQAFTQRYSSNSFIISSRTTDDIYGLNEYSVFSLCRMDMKQVSQLILKLDFSMEVKKDFIDKLVEGLYEKYKDFVSVPLLLSILFITYIGNTDIPDTLCEFYDLAFNTMLYRHDNLKAGFERPLSSGLSKAEFKKVFMRFCLRTYFNDSYSFSETSLIDNIHAVGHVISTLFDEYAYKNDLVDISSMIIRDGLEYTFIHRSFQEYFAAVWVSESIEEEQREFCAEFIYSMQPENEDAFVNHFSQTPLDAIRNKTIDFLKMLHDINPKRFEQVVLKPILEKINTAYEECDKNIVCLPHKFFYVYNAIEQDTYERIGYPIFDYFINFKSTLENDEFEQFNLEEYNVLCYFYRHLLSNRYSSTYSDIRNEMIKLLENHNDITTSIQIKEEGVNYTLIRTLGAPDLYHEHSFILETHASLLSFFKIMLTRYDAINQKNQRNKRRMIFKERINKV